MIDLFDEPTEPPFERTGPELRRLRNTLLNDLFIGSLGSFLDTGRDSPDRRPSRVEARDTMGICQVSGSVQWTAANPARSGRKQR